MLNVEHITVWRGRKLVLDDISFALPPGQVAAVLGLNGAGKTTLLKAILGFLPRRSGTISWEGQPLDRLSPADRAKRLAYVPQTYDGGFRYTAEEFVSMGGTAYLGAFSQPGADGLRRAKEILSSLNCQHLVGRAMDRLSGGERRMAYLARAVMQEASCLLLDEPVSSLDFSRQHIFLNSLRRFVKDRQAGCLLTIHAPELACAYADRILILHDKKLLMDVERADPLFEKKLRISLTALYGEALRMDFCSGGLVLGWEPPSR